MLREFDLALEESILLDCSAGSGGADVLYAPLVWRAHLCGPVPPYVGSFEGWLGEESILLGS